jgi:hypothetical protein
MPETGFLEQNSGLKPYQNKQKVCFRTLFYIFTQAFAASPLRIAKDFPPLQLLKMHIYEHFTKFVIKPFLKCLPPEDCATISIQPFCPI